MLARRNPGGLAVQLRPVGPQRGQAQPGSEVRGGAGELGSRPQVPAVVAARRPPGGGLLQPALRAECDRVAPDGVVQRRPGGEERLVRHPDDHPALVLPVGVGGAGGLGGSAEESVLEERVQLGDDLGRQLGERHPDPGRPALLVHVDQPHQRPDHRSPVAAAVPDRLGQCLVRLCGERALHAAELVVAREREPAAALHALGQLGQRVGQQRQGLPAAGVGDQLVGQPVVQLDSGDLGRSLDHRPECRPAQRFEGVDAFRQAGQLRAGEQRVEELRAQCCDDLQRPGESRADHVGELRARLGARPGQQLLELVDDQDHPRPPRPGNGEQQLVDDPAQAMGRHSPPNLLDAPARQAQPARPRLGQLDAHAAGRIPPGHDRRERELVRVLRDGRQQARAHQGGLAAPGRPDQHEQRPIGPLGGRAERFDQPLDVGLPAEEQPVPVGVERKQPGKRLEIVGYGRPRPVERHQPPAQSSARVVRVARRVDRLQVREQRMAHAGLGHDRNHEGAPGAGQRHLRSAPGGSREG